MHVCYWLIVIFYAEKKLLQGHVADILEELERTKKKKRSWETNKIY